MKEARRARLLAESQDSFRLKVRFPMRLQVKAPPIKGLPIKVLPVKVLPVKVPPVKVPRHKE